jgi:hypothetical protein
MIALSVDQAQHALADLRKGQRALGRGEGAASRPGEGYPRRR